MNYATVASTLGHVAWKATRRRWSWEWGKSISSSKGNYSKNPNAKSISSDVVLNCSGWCRKRWYKFCSDLSLVKRTEVSAANSERAAVQKKAEKCSALNGWRYKWPKVSDKRARGCVFRMDCAPNVNIFRELQTVHDTGFFRGHVSPEEEWQQVWKEGAGAAHYCTFERNWNFSTARTNWNKCFSY